MQVKIESSWQKALQEEFDAPYFAALTAFVREAYASHTCYPPAGKLFAAFNLCPLEKVKVVLLGQDPYHEPGQAEGLCFSVPEGIGKPPSLQNIFKEIEGDLGRQAPENGSLARWATQGVLLLNATLSVEAHKAGSHQGKGWEQFTDAVISRLSASRPHLVFLLWGAYARKKATLIDQRKHLVLQSAHPSPLSAYRGFFGNKHFSRTNAFLIEKGEQPIVW